MIRNVIELVRELWQAFAVRACPCGEVIEPDPLALEVVERVRRDLEGER